MARAAVLLGALMAVAAAPAAGAGAQPRLEFRIEAPPPTAVVPDLAMDRRGNALAAWAQRDDTARTATVQVASRPTRGQWSAPETLTSPAPFDTTFDDWGIRDVQVAVSRRGDAVVAWTRAVAGSHVIEAATRRRDGAWSTRTVVTVAAPFYSMFPPGVISLIGGARGHAMIAWTVWECPPEGCAPGRMITRTAALLPDGGWSAPETLISTESFQPEPQFALDRHGGALAVWTEGTHVEFATRPQGGTWSAPQPFAEVGRWDLTGVQIAMNARGDAVALWHGSNTNDNDVGTAMNAVSVRRAHGAWSIPAVLGTTIYYDFRHVAIDARGNALVIGDLPVPNGLVLGALTRPARGAWSAPEPLGPGGGFTALAVNPFGEAVLGVASTGPLTMQALRRRADGRWSAPQLIESDGAYYGYPPPRAAISDDAQGILLWQKVVADDRQSLVRAAASRGRHRFGPPGR